MMCHSVGVSMCPYLFSQTSSSSRCQPFEFVLTIGRGYTKKFLSLHLYHHQSTHGVEPKAKRFAVDPQ